MFDFKVASIDWVMVMPLIVLITTGTINLMIKMFRPKHRNRRIVMVTAIGLIVAGALEAMQLGLPDKESFGQMLYRDAFATVIHLVLIGSCLFVVLFSEGYLREKQIAFREFYPLTLWATVGGMLMVGTKSLMMIFIGIEVLSISLYVLSGLSRQEGQSEESALKYFLLGAFASCFLLYGIAFVYGATGGFHLDLLGLLAQYGNNSVIKLLLFSIVLMLIGILFKGSFFPFHQWTPDVYQGAPTNVTAFMATVSKVASIAVLYRVLESVLVYRVVWFPVLFWIAILTMVVGNVVAIWQKDLKRTLAYSSIAHAGYLLVAILAHCSDPQRIGIGSTVFYMISYCLTSLATFGILTLCTRSGQENTKYESLNGLWHKSPVLGFVLLVSMASFIGIPPTAGFFGKLFIFSDAIDAGQHALAVVLALASALSVYYYLGIVQAMFARGENQMEYRIYRHRPGLYTVCAICLAGLFTLGFCASSIFQINKQPEERVLAITENQPSNKE